MSTNSDNTYSDDTIRDRVRGQSDEGGMLGRRDEDLHAAGSSFEDDLTDAGRGDAGGDSDGAPDSGPDDGMGPNDPDDIAGEDEPVPGIDDEAEDDR